MKYQDKNSDSDWAKEVPDRRFRGPYEDFGWEPGESILPEFRDPSIHLTPHERFEREQQRQRQRRQTEFRGETHRYGRREIPDHERDPYGWSENYGEPFARGYGGEDQRGGREPWRQQGPYTGRGPRNYQRSDERIFDDVCQRLTWNGQIDPRNIKVEVHNGEVTLQGMVDSRRTKRMVEDTVDSVSGVQDIKNELNIQRNNVQS